jgi:hypothetical protein
MRRLRGATILVALLLLVPQTGHAARTKLKLTDAQATKMCREGPGSTCGSRASAAVSGAFLLDSYMISPRSGLAPGTGLTTGRTFVTSDFALKRKTRSLRLTAVIRIDAASVRHTGALRAKESASMPRANADLYAILSASSYPCKNQKCPLDAWAFQIVPLLDLLKGPFSISRRTLTLRLKLVPAVLRPDGIKPAKRGSYIKPGRVYFNVGLISSAQLGATTEKAFTGMFPRCIDKACAVSTAKCYDPDCTVTLYRLVFGCQSATCGLGSPKNLVFGCIVDCATAPPLRDHTMPDTGVARAFAGGRFLALYAG